jgi:hypothetical protein
MFCPNCKAEYREGFFECADCNIQLVEKLPLSNEITVKKRKGVRIKKRPFIGITTIVLSLPVIIWISVLIISKKNYHADTIRAFLFIFQGVGIIGGILLCFGIIYGHYLTICTWVYYFCYQIIRWYQWFIEHNSSVMSDQTIPYFLLFNSLLYILVGIFFLYILFKDLREKHNKANSADAKSSAPD